METQPQILTLINLICQNDFTCIVKDLTGTARSLIAVSRHDAYLCKIRGERSNSHIDLVNAPYQASCQDVLAQSREKTVTCSTGTLMRQTDVLKNLCFYVPFFTREDKLTCHCKLMSY